MGSRMIYARSREPVKKVGKIRRFARGAKQVGKNVARTSGQIATSDEAKQLGRGAAGIAKEGIKGMAVGIGAGAAAAPKLLRGGKMSAGTKRMYTPQGMGSLLLPPKGMASPTIKVGRVGGFPNLGLPKLRR